MIVQIFIFTFGLIVGSFLNVCIYRLGREMSVARPARSFCPSCKKIIPWFDNIPVFSFIALLGRCRFCRKKISLRYPFIELLTACAFVFIFRQFGISPQLFCYSIFLSLLIVATFVDIDFQIIPDEISIGGIVAGFILSFVFPVLHNTDSYFISAGKSLIGILLGGGIIYLLGVIGDLVFKKESMGGGDVKLLAMIGAFLGWEKALLTFFLAPFMGAIISVVINLWKLDPSAIKGTTKERFKKVSELLFTGVIPYGPFLCAGAVISMFYIDKILKLIFY